jgi:hypothetical protein
MEAAAELLSGVWDGMPMDEVLLNLSDRGWTAATGGPPEQPPPGGATGAGTRQQQQGDGGRGRQAVAAAAVTLGPRWASEIRRQEQAMGRQQQPQQQQRGPAAAAAAAAGGGGGGGSSVASLQRGSFHHVRHASSSQQQQEHQHLGVLQAAGRSSSRARHASVAAPCSQQLPPVLMQLHQPRGVSGVEASSSTRRRLGTVVASSGRAVTGSPRMRAAAGVLGAAVLLAADRLSPPVAQGGRGGRGLAGGGRVHVRLW